MRHYRFEATDETIEALRRLRAAWAAYGVADDALTVRLADGSAVRVEAESAGVEPGFEAFRLTAAVTDLASEAVVAMPAFAEGRNDVVVFAGATWVEEPDPLVAELRGDDTTLQLTGHPGQISPTASAVCLTTDAVVFASTAGTGLLVRLGPRPYSLEVHEDSVVIARFLVERGYTAP